MENMNKTTLRLEVDKTIQPKRFEPLKIIVDIQESFYWKDEADREKKMKAHSAKLTEDFINTFDQVVERVGEKDRCIGHVVQVNEASDPVSSDPVSSDPVSDGEFSFD